MNKQNPGIGWCDYTLNQMTGCLNHVNGLCKGGGFKCFAYIIANRFKERYLANMDVAPIQFFQGSNNFQQSFESRYRDPFYPRIWSERFEPLKGYPEGTKIFLNDMSDWMGPWIPNEWKVKTFEFIRAHPQYIFQTLTKQPQELPKWEFPENCWVGVTATNMRHWIGALYGLDAIEAKVKFVSFEPLLERIILKGIDAKGVVERVNWVIIGQQTPVKAATTPKIEDICEIVEAADKAGVKVFLKDNLYPLWDKKPLSLCLQNKYNADLLRQESPC